MEIRKLKYTDIPQLALLYKHFWNEQSNIEKMEETFDKLKNNDSYIFLCAVDNDKICGSVMGIVCNGLYGNCDPFLLVEDMVVDINYRRKGIGRKLFLELEKEAKMRKCTGTILVTDSNREDACKFYESMGFSPTKNKGYKRKYDKNK
jgi:ribosomal protein S18 acetylase RimI-like enzyme